MYTSRWLSGPGKQKGSSALDLAVETVRTYRKTLMKKFNVHNVALLAMEKDSGIVPNPNSK
jgi:FixJ family two-component response regulator